MSLEKNLHKRNSILEYVLIIVLLLYLALDIQTPVSLVSITNNVMFQLFLGVLIVLLFIYANPIIGILAMISLFTLINRSTTTQQNLIPNEIYKQTTIKTFNPPATKSTLEQEIVSKMAPYRSTNNLEKKYQSILSDTHNAAALNDLQN